MGKSDPFPLGPLKGMEPFFGQIAKELFPAKPECFHLAFLGNKRGNHGQGRGLGVEASSGLSPASPPDQRGILQVAILSPQPWEQGPVSLSIRVKPAVLPRWWAGVGQPSRRLRGQHAATCLLINLGGSRRPLGLPDPYILIYGVPE